MSRRSWVFAVLAAAVVMAGVAGGCRSAVEDFYAPLTRPPECGGAGSAGAAPSGGGGGGGGELATGGAETCGQGGDGGCPVE